MHGRNNKQSNIPLLYLFCRGQNRVNGPAALIERGEGGEAQTASGTDTHASRPGERDLTRGGMAHSLLGFQSRSPLFRTLSRSSSGYFSFDFDSVPSSPRMTDNKATQTPSPSSQAISHAQRRISDVTQNPQHYEMPQAPPRPFRARSLSLPMDIRPEVWVAQELRRIGDELNHLYLHRCALERTLPCDVISLIITLVLNMALVLLPPPLCVWLRFSGGAQLSRDVRRHRAQNQCLSHLSARAQSLPRAAARRCWLPAAQNEPEAPGSEGLLGTFTLDRRLHTRGRPHLLFQNLPQSYKQRQGDSFLLWSVTGPEPSQLDVGDGARTEPGLVGRRQNVRIGLRVWRWIGRLWILLRPR
ncbi:hypothetical protein COCON_G00227330 [Conger conger]|uniref:Bcl-x interacting BH3 domain-containing protein n=1 Tax=Conger conger TaxID=82655 RepID=A0A9Q1CX90_CONCO|nr:hypothetical protein COCON_G00227330 [Conger conger]